MMFDKKNAMTYIELIMVIAIIGTVSAVSLPALKRHSQKTEFAALAKKAYTDLEDAMDNAVLTEGPMRNWDFSSNATFCSKYLAPNMNVMKNNCDATTPSITTRSMMTMQVAECDGSFCHVHVDVNGSKRPNLVGKDLFEFQVSRVDKGGIYTAESVQPASHGGANLLRQNGWKFTDRLWRCEWTTNNGNNCGL